MSVEFDASGRADITTPEDRSRDLLSDAEKAARDWWHRYQEWQCGLWVVLNRRDAVYRTVAMAEADAKHAASWWPGEHWYAEPVSRPHLDLTAPPTKADQ